MDKQSEKIVRAPEVIQTPPCNPDLAGLTCLFLMTVVGIVAILTFTWDGLPTPHSARELKLLQSIETIGRPFPRD